MNYDQTFFGAKKHKRFFKFNSSLSNISICLYSSQDCQFLFDLGNDNFKYINLKKGQYFIFEQIIDKYFGILFDNYCIQKIDCSNNQIDFLQLQQARHLNALNISRNKLKYIYIDLLDNLIQFNAKNNFLSQIDVTKNKKLKYLDVSSNNLKSIDISNNQNLITADLSNNQIKSLIINKNIQYLNLNNNQLDYIIIPYNSELKYLNISNNDNVIIIVDKNNQKSNYTVEQFLSYKMLNSSLPIFNSNIIV